MTPETDNANPRRLPPLAPRKSSRPLRKKPKPNWTKRCLHHQQASQEIEASRELASWSSSYTQGRLNRRFGVES